MRIITGRARGLKLTTPKNWDVRPTADRVKESLFNIIGSKIIGAQVLDLFAGTGNLGLESWSRGAEKLFLPIQAKNRCGWWKAILPNAGRRRIRKQFAGMPAS